MELLSWAFVLLLPSWIALPYLIIQRFFIFVIFIGVGLSPILIVWTLLFKIGVPPFHAWILMLIYYREVVMFLFINLIHKVLPIILLSKIVYTNMLVFWISLRVTIRIRIIMQLRTLFQVVLFSSIIHSMWIILSAMVSFIFFLFYWLFYMLGSIFLLVGRSIKFTRLLTINQTSVILLIWLLISGVPPFIIFWLKAELTTWLISSGHVALATILIVASILSLSTYYRSAHIAMERSFHRNETHPVLFIRATIASIF